MLFQKLLGATTSGIRLVGSKTFIDAGGVSSFSVDITNLTGGLDSSPKQGDFVLVYFGLATNGLSAAPAMSVTGYTDARSVLFVNGTYEANLLVAYKFMTSTPDTSVTLSCSGTGVVQSEDAKAGAVFVFRGVDTTTPIEDSGSTSSISSTLITNFSAKPVGPNRVGVFGGISAHQQNVGTYSSADLDGFVTSIANDFNDCSVGVGYKPNLSSSFTPSQFTFSGSSTGAFAAFTATLKPA
jgi:hydrogenase maturation factor